MITKLSRKLFLNRGKKFVPNPELEKGWYKESFVIKNRSLICLYRKPDSGECKAVVILAHPYLTEAKHFFLRTGIAEMYAKAGFVVYLPDFNGFGESQTRDFCFYTDLIEVGDQVNQRHKNLNIILHGVSFGASQAIVAANIKAHLFSRLIIENCLDYNLNYYKVRNKKMYYFTWILFKLFPNLNKDHNYVQSIQTVKHIEKILFIYCSSDELTTVKMGEQLFNNSPVESSMEIFGGPHLEAFMQEPTRYKNVIMDWVGINF